MDKQAKERLLAEAKARYNRDIEAIERVWELSQQKNGNGNGAHSAGNSLKGMTLVQAVNWAVEAHHGSFSIREIMRAVKEQDHGLGEKLAPTYVSSLLKRLHEEGKIFQITKAAGPNPAQYRKPDDNGK